MILASFYLTTMVPIINLFLLSIFIFCLIAMSLSHERPPRDCVHHHANRGPFFPIIHHRHGHGHAHGHDHHPNIHGHNG